jgi:hypothetical protein
MKVKFLLFRYRPRDDGGQDPLRKPSDVFGGSSATFRVRWRAPYSSMRGKAIASIATETNAPADPLCPFPRQGRYRQSRSF